MRLALRHTPLVHALFRVTKLGAILLLLSPGPAKAQFTEVLPGLPKSANPCVVWGDYDRDGDLDVLVAGVGKQDVAFATIYNNTDGVFTNSGIVLLGLSRATAAWGDFDGDGDLDLAMTGLTSAGIPTTRIYRNDGGTFTPVAGNFTGVFAGTVTWGDYDGDGDLDLLVTGTATAGATGTPTTRVYRNDRGVFTPVAHPFPNCYLGSAAWGDYNNDGKLDVVITGVSDNGALVAAIWRNEGGGGFSDAGANLPGMDLGQAAWGDYDNDGDLDLLFTGNSNDGWITRIYRNNGGTFTDANAGLLGLIWSSAAWGDYDNDGDLDLMVMGYDPQAQVRRSILYRNDAGTFVDSTATFHNVFLGTVSWVDYDNDGHLDLSLAGNELGSDILSLYHNTTAAQNTAPSAPANLTANVLGTRVNLSWSPASDAQTPPVGLTYNLRIGTTPGAGDIVCPQSSPAGYRHLPEMGNAQLRTTAQIGSLRPGTNYFWSVQAVDTAFVGSAFAIEGSFTAQSDPPGVGSIAREGSGSVRVTWQGTPGQVYQVLSSTNLSNWSLFAAATADSNGLFDIVDSTTEAAKFYRAALPSLVSPQAAQSSEVLYSQFSDGKSTYGPSELWTSAAISTEVADDFDVTGSIDRVVAGGFTWGIVDFRGVYVRFYEFGADNKPGALQKEYFLSATDPNLIFDASYGTVDARLSQPFAASGKHFLSVQPVINYWYWWSSQTGAPHGQAFYFRDLAAGQTAWHHGDNLNFNFNADVAFALYGTATGPGTISNVSTNTLARSGYLEIFGNNFGASGQVLVDGISAPIATWQSTRIVAYVPEAARLTTVPVQVINSSGRPGNPGSLTVTTRQSSGRVNWRFRMDGPYAQVRPALAADGTLYPIDAFGHLYALAPDGRLKWVVRGAGDKGVAVGADGTVYVASEPFINAYNPDGTMKWSFVPNPHAFICLGVSVGPDGNIYSVGTQGMGVFSLTPAGTLRWTNAEPYSRPIVGYAEIVFGPNAGKSQLYFFANNHIRALGLDGSSVFTLPGGVAQLGPGLQPVVAPDGTMHTALSAYSPTGSPRWTFPTPYPYNTFTPATIDSAGIHYFVQNLGQVFALNPDGSQRWHIATTNYLGGPIVDPLNRQLVMGSANTLDHPGFILSASAADGHELWRVPLPPEDPAQFNTAVGIYGFNQYVDTRARFSMDGSTAYILTATAAGNNNTSKSFVYSLNAAPGTP
jgi:hypothetical protein